MADLDILLTGEEPEEKLEGEKNFGLNELYISKYAYEKAFRYAELVMRERSDSVEIGGFLTTQKGANDRVARDAFLARDQEVSRGFYKLSAEDVLKAKKEIEDKEQKIIGWWHSHGRFDAYHSETDSKNQMVLLNQISTSNYIPFPKERDYDSLQSRIEGNKIIFWDPEDPIKKFELELKEENPELVAKRLKILEDKKIGFAYSFVVNNHRWLRKRVPYFEIATRDLCVDCINANDVSVPVGYKIFDEGEYKIDDEQLIAEINERVHVFGEGHKNKKYLLPSTFEEQRMAGTLSKPDFGSISKVRKRKYYRTDEGSFKGKKKEEQKDDSKEVGR
ncbi:MAG TPA: Mov34/MPN/PAD-1 family protein [Candidatus Nanoarchaeia archaeon]|nr:Mov34/MPN/PAD-1 family protein [Candidatus Nanoarchaeia archaeon]